PAGAAYRVAGVGAGPGGLGLVSRSDTIAELAELGVALLLFGVGIEFSLERLRQILPRMLASGTLQVGLTVGATAVVFTGLGTAWPAAVFIGFLVSLSSTAIVFKLYEEDGGIDAPQGQAAAGILLFQDLALVPMMLLVPVLARPGEAGVLGAALALVKAAGAIVVLLVLARAILPRLLALIARSGTPELFPLAAVVIAFGTALGAARLGLSLPLGAFLAGMGLAQIGEFAFVLGHDGVAAGVIAPRVEQVFLAAAILSMAATPFLVRLARRLALMGAEAPATTAPPELRDHVLVIGCGTT